MPTVSVALDQEQYVRINTALNPMVLQAPRDTVRIVISTLKPSKDNEVFHTLGGQDEPLHFHSIDTNVWALSMSDQSSLIVSETKPVSVNYGDSPAIDAFGRLRTGEPFGIFDNKNIANRNRNQWEEIITGVVITYGTLTGTFSPTEEIRGTLPLGIIPIATVVTDNGADSMVINVDHNDFQVGDTITGQTSGATAVVVSADTGSDIQFDYDTASVELIAGTGATDKAIRHSHRYHAYVPGKSQFILMTFVLGAAKNNVVRRVGYFDDNDGLFLEQNGTVDVALVVRTSTSGSPSDAKRYLQSNWNIDRLDGTGPSGLTLDLTKTQILFFDFQWLGVGRVRFGFDIDGRKVIVHEELNANVSAVVFMRTPTLPVRYEIANSGVTASPTSMNEICCSVVSEGGYQLPGFEFSQSRGVSSRTVSARTPIFAIRLKNSIDGQDNRKTAKFLNAGVVTATNDAHFEVAHIHEAVDVVATWNDVGGGSGMEYSTDITALTGRPEHIIEHIDATTSAGNKAKSDIVIGEFISAHGYINQNYDSTNSQMFVIYATPVTGNADVRGHMTWIEFD